MAGKRHPKQTVDEDFVPTLTRKKRFIPWRFIIALLFVPPFAFYVSGVFFASADGYSWGLWLLIALIAAAAVTLMHLRESGPLGGMLFTLLAFLISTLTAHSYARIFGIEFVMADVRFAGLIGLSVGSVLGGAFLAWWMQGGQDWRSV